MSTNANDRIEVDPAHAAPPRVASPVLGSTTAAASGIKDGHPFYDHNTTREQHLGTGAGIDGTPIGGVRGNSIENHRQVDAYPEDHKDRPDSMKKNDIEVQNGDRLTDSDVSDEGRELNWFQKFCKAHAKEIRIAIHVVIGVVMTG